jgi:uncharacterized YigZ family protein
VSEGEDRFLEPAAEAVVEMTEKRSRFIAAVRVARTPLEAKEAVREIASARPDANHHCWAYRVGVPPSEYYSDAGEPSGTAGKPILGAIQRAGTTNTVVVVTRYFGGIKLGVRGLIEAYGASARKALEAAGAVLKVASRTAVIRLSYEEQGNLRFYLRELGVEAEAVNCRYEEKVIMEVPVPLSAEGRAAALFDSLLAQKQILDWEWR